MTNENYASMLLEYFSNDYIGTPDCSRIVQLLSHRAPSRWDEALSLKVFYEKATDADESIRPFLRQEPDDHGYYYLKPMFKYNAPNLKSGAGFPYAELKKGDVLVDVKKTVDEIYMKISNGASYKEITDEYTELVLLQVKPKREVYTLCEDMSETTGGVTTPNEDYDKLSRTEKCRSIFNVSFVAGYGAQKLSSLIYNSMPAANQVYIGADGLEFYPLLEKRVFSLSSFAPVHGYIDLLFRRVQNQAPFTKLLNKPDLGMCGYSDNMYVFFGTLRKPLAVDESSSVFRSFDAG